MQPHKAGSCKIPNFSPSPFKGVVSYIKRPYHSLRARSFSLTPLSQPDFSQINNGISASNSMIPSNSNFSPTFKGNPKIDFSSSEISLHQFYFLNEVSSLDLDSIIEESQKCSLNDFCNPSFEIILQKKLELCSYMFSFNSTDKVEQRDFKTETLNQFATLFETPNSAAQLNPFHRRAIFQMLEKNIFSNDPKFPTFSQLAELPPPSTDPSWPHRSICYQILIQFIQLFPESEYFNINFIKNAICHFQLPDANERLQLVVFIKKYIDIYEKRRAFILPLIRNAMFFLNEGLYNPYCLMPLMALFSHLIFKYYDSMKDDIQAVFFEAVIPLMSYKYLTISFPHIKNVFLLMIRTDRDIIFLTLRKLQKLWPHQNNTKQVVFVDLLISVASTLEQRFFEKISSNFFSFLRDLLYSQQFKLIDTIVNIFVIEGYSAWITTNSSVAIDKLYEPIAIISLSYTDKIIKNKCINAIRAMSSLNNSEFTRCESLFKNKQKVAENHQPKNGNNRTINRSQSKPIINKENDNDASQIIKAGVENNFFFIHNHDLKKERRNKEIWMTITNFASMNNLFANDIEQKNKQEEINKTFSNDKKDNFMISRFLPSSFNQIEPVKNIVFKPTPKFLIPTMQIPKQKRSTMRMSVPKCTFFYNLSKSDTNLHI
ncbi:hypothetical protein M9Y10_034046 [Tritrichomonas musculus]|uniref:Phosphoprotein phosphatase n=1 Tax=Tritrichomonas musculus TaxID=1915356 RepID=A0ABR2KDW6_9EUKA